VITFIYPHHKHIGLNTSASSTQITGFPHSFTKSRLLFLVNECFSWGQWPCYLDTAALTSLETPSYTPDWFYITSGWTLSTFIQIIRIYPLQDLSPWHAISIRTYAIVEYTFSDVDRLVYITCLIYMESTHQSTKTLTLSLVQTSTRTFSHFWFEIIMYCLLYSTHYTVKGQKFCLLYHKTYLFINTELYIPQILKVNGLLIV